VSGARFEAATNGPVKLSDFYNDEIRPRLTPELVYDWPGHDWHRSHGKWRGACPQHTSESGTSFNVSLDTLAWFCPACDVGGGPVQYVHWRQGGTGSPRGREFVEVLRDLADRIGLTLPERELTDEERARAEAAAAKRGALELVYRVCQDRLWSDAGTRARSYLHGRGINDDAIHALELGLYPPLAEIRAKLRAAGYATEIGTGCWQKLVGYGTFPWRDDYGQPLTLYGRWPGTTGWPNGCEKTMALPGEGSKSSPLYFDRLRRAHHDDAVLVEGLLDAAVAQANELTNVVAYVGGQPSHAQHRVLARHRIKTATICSDPDKGGEGGIVSFLRNVAPSIRAYVAPRLPDGTDPDQFILAGGVEGWREHIARADPGHIWRTRHILGRHDLATPKGRDDAREELAEYARPRLPHERDDITNVASGPLQMDAGTLRRYLAGDDRRNGHASAATGDQPSPAGDAVLNDVHAFLGRFVAYPSKHAHVAHTLWVAHTHLMGAWESTPRIAFLSPEPGSGKTRALEITELLVPRPVEAVNVTPAYLFRKVGDAAGLPTILYDEIDTVFGPKAKDNEEIRGLLNAGHRRGAVAGRCVVKGKIVETEEIPAYCAVALAGLGGLPDTILSRSVILRMRRRAPGEHVEPYRRRLHVAEGHAIRDRVKLWAASVEETAADYWPEMPPGIVDRDSDVWEALLTVADLAGGDWPERSRCGAVALVADSKEGIPSLGVRLLGDLRTIFEGHDVLSTDSILGALNGLEESPWGEIANGKPLNARGLARRLRPYGVSSKTFRIGTTTPKGYAAADFADAWERYVPSSRQKSATSATVDASPSGQGVADNVADNPDVADESATEPPDPEIDLCASCGAKAVEMIGLDCDECMGGDERP
jgi:hypothetical protein